MSKIIILGINEVDTATAAIIKNGKVLVCASEERFTGVKNSTGYPKKAIDFVLRQSNTRPDNIDFVVLGTKYLNPLQMRLKRTETFTVSDYVREMHEYWKPILLENKKSNFWHRLSKEKRFADIIKKDFCDYCFLDTTPESEWEELSRKARSAAVQKHLNTPNKKISFIDHHIAHAHYAYFASPHDVSKRAVVIAADTWGDGANSTISIAEGGRLTELHRTQNCNLSRIYRWVTLLLGMKPNEHEYKVMGLAPYAPPSLAEQAYDVFKKTLIVDGIDFAWRNKPKDMYFHFQKELEGIRFDGVAAGLQRWLEELLAEWVTNVMKFTKTDILYYSGDLALNVKANKIISELSRIKEFYVPPSGGDDSLAIGSAFAFLSEQNLSSEPLKDVYLGPDISDEEALSASSKLLKNSDYKLIINPDPKMIAKHLAAGLVIARCVGRMEFGARALGNRSILCDPSKLENIHLLNKKIKFRDFWMPFTPSILEERAVDYIINSKNLPAPWMTLAFDTTELGRAHLKAALHPADFTVRPQLVNKLTSPDYYQLIKEFENITGIGALLNTSFNIHGKPIVCTAEDAITAFQQSAIDGIVLPGLLILKNEKNTE